MKQNGPTVVGKALSKLNIAVQKRYGGIENFIIKNDPNEDSAELSLDIGCAAHISNTIKKSTEMMVMRSESAPRGMEQEQIDDIGAEIIEKIDGRMTSYDGVLTVMKAVTFAKLSEEAAERLIYNETMAFIQTIILFKNKLEGNPEDGSNNASGFADAAYGAGSDPFGFDTIFDSEDELHNDDHSSKEEFEELSSLNGAGSSTEEYSDPMNEALESIANDGGVTHQVDNDEILSVLNHSKSQDEENLNAILDEIENEKPLDFTLPDVSELIPTPKVIDVAGEAVPEDIDIFNAVDTYSGDDQFGLVEQTRAFRLSAQEAVTQLHQMLSNLYAPVYQLSLGLYDRNKQLTMQETNVQQLHASLEDRQRRVDAAEAQLLREKQEFVQERTAFRAYRAQFQDMIQDYDSKCKLVGEQSIQIQAQAAQLMSSQATIMQLQAKLQAVMAGDGEEKFSKEYVQALKNANEQQAAHIEQQDERIAKYRGAIAQFKVCQENWAQQESIYKELIRSLANSTTINSAAQTEIDEAKQRIAELEIAVATQTQIATEKSTLAEEQRTRADAAEQRGVELKAKLDESSNRTEEMERRALQAENDLANEQRKSDVVYSTNQICDLFSGMGVELDVVAGDGEMILTGSHNGIQYIVDMTNHIIHVKQIVKKPSRYAKRVEQLNQENIHVSYSVGEKEITCRVTFSDIQVVGSQMISIMAEFAAFK